VISGPPLSLPPPAAPNPISSPCPGPPGHALDPRQRGTAAAFLLARYPEMAGIGDPLARGRTVPATASLSAWPAAKLRGSRRAGRNRDTVPDAGGQHVRHFPGILDTLRPHPVLGLLDEKTPLLDPKQIAETSGLFQVRVT